MPVAARTGRSRMTLVAIGFLVAVLLWIAGGAFAVAGIEQPKYDVVAKRDGYEVRRYASMLVAETDMPTLGSSDRGASFQALAGYIFGGNKTRDGIAMTAPVAMGPSQKIAMTAPVVMGPSGGSTAGDTRSTMRFVLPSKYKTLADLPVPNDPRVRLVEVPSRTLAVSSFSWFASEARVGEMSAALLAALQRDRVTATGAPVLASYNPPFTPPFMQKHEIMVEIAP